MQFVLYRFLQFFGEEHRFAVDQYPDTEHGLEEVVLRFCVILFRYTGKVSDMVTIFNIDEVSESQSFRRGCGPVAKHSEKTVEYVGLYAFLRCVCVPDSLGVVRIEDPSRFRLLVQIDKGENVRDVCESGEDVEHITRCLGVDRPDADPHNLTSLVNDHRFGGDVTERDTAQIHSRVRCGPISAGDTPPWRASGQTAARSRE